MLVADRASTDLFERSIALGASRRATPRTGSRRTWPACSTNTGSTPASSPVTPEHLVELIELVADDTVSGAGAKQALEDAVQTGDGIGVIVERLALRQVSDAGALGAIVDEVLAEHADASSSSAPARRA